jgi:TRAP-type C4-dicarboxylate transport system permease large subunit
MTQLMVLQVIVLLAIVLFPGIALWLPHHLFK